MVTSRRAAAVVIVTALSLLAGCGRSSPNRATVYPVTGSVQTKGKGIAHVWVTFLALDRQEGPGLETEVLTNPDGQFRATTYDTGDGLPPGHYAVFLIWPDVVTDDPALGGDKLRGRYNDRQKPAFTIEVKPEPNNIPSFDVK